MYKLNIGTRAGLTGKTTPLALARTYLDYVLSEYPGAKVLTYHTEVSDGGDWGPEPVMVVEIEPGSFSIERISEICNRIARLLYQDAIAVYHIASGKGWLHWNSDCLTPESDRYDFDMDYFLH